mgnify:FL=1
MRVTLTKKAEKQLHKLEKIVAKKILVYLHEVSRLEDPRSRGKALSGNLKSLWRYRVGDYRILCYIEEEKILVTVVKIGHRREVYKCL